MGTSLRSRWMWTWDRRGQLVDVWRVGVAETVAGVLAAVLSPWSGLGQVVFGLLIAAVLFLPVYLADAMLRAPAAMRVEEQERREAELRRVEDERRNGMNAVVWRERFK